MHLGARREGSSHRKLAFNSFYGNFTDMTYQVLNDANVDAAARGIISGAFVHSGQACIGTERVIVQRGAAQKLIEKIKALAVKVRAADQSVDPRAQLGLVFNPGSAQNIISMIKEAIASGAELLHGDLKYDGALVQPHVVLGAKPGTRLWDRESFGPGVYTPFGLVADHPTDSAFATQ